MVWPGMMADAADPFFLLLLLALLAKSLLLFKLLEDFRFRAHTSIMHFFAFFVSKKVKRGKSEN